DATVLGGLGGGADPVAQTVEVVLGGGEGVPAGGQAEADPDHVVLGGESGEEAEGVALVAVLGGGVGEAGGVVVGAVVVHEAAAGGLGEGVEGGGGTAHVGGGAEDDRVGVVELLPVLVGDGVHRDEGDLGSGLLGTTPDAFGENGGVSVAGV